LPNNKNRSDTMINVQRDAPFRATKRLWWYEIGGEVQIKWVRGTIQQKLGALSYEVRVGSEVWRRHADQLLGYSGAIETEVNTDVISQDTGWPTPVPEERSDQESAETESRPPMDPSSAPEEPDSGELGTQEPNETLVAISSPTPSTQPVTSQTETYPRRHHREAYILIYNKNVPFKLVAL
jgi:hypothetical protein